MFCLFLRNGGDYDYNDYSDESEPEYEYEPEPEPIPEPEELDNSSESGFDMHFSSSSSSIDSEEDEENEDIHVDEGIVKDYYGPFWSTVADFRYYLFNDEGLLLIKGIVNHLPNRTK